MLTGITDLKTARAEIRMLYSEIKKLEAENKKLRKACEPLVCGTFWITAVDVKRAKKALGLTPDNAAVTGGESEA